MMIQEIGNLECEPISPVQVPDSGLHGGLVLMIVDTCRYL